MTLEAIGVAPKTPNIVAKYVYWPLETLFKLKAAAILTNRHLREITAR